MKRLTFSLWVILLPLVLAQPQVNLNIPSEFFASQNFFYFILLPLLGTTAFFSGILIRIGIFSSRSANLVIAFISSLILQYVGILPSIVVTLNSISLSTVLFFFGLLTLIGLGIYSTSGGVFYERKFYESRSIRRKHLPPQLSRKEKEIANVETRLSKLKIEEDRLESQYAMQKTDSLRRRLESVRRQRVQLANIRDKLMREREQMLRLYRETTT